MNRSSVAPQSFGGAPRLPCHRARISTASSERIDSPVRTEALEGTTRVYALAPLRFFLAATDKKKLGMTNPNRLMGALDPNGDRRPLIQVTSIIEHDRAVDDFARVQNHGYEDSASEGVGLLLAMT